MPPVRFLPLFKVGIAFLNAVSFNGCHHSVWWTLLFFSSCAHRTTYVQETMNQNFLLASMNFSLSRDAPNAPAAMTANSASM
jgi:hypothetical protein